LANGDGFETIGVGKIVKNGGCAISFLGEGGGRGFAGDRTAAIQA